MELKGDAALDDVSRVHEFERLRLDVALVTGSTCDTGRGLLNSEGVIRMPGAFPSAGPKQVLASLWLVAGAVTGNLSCRRLGKIGRSTCVGGGRGHRMLVYVNGCSRLAGAAEHRAPTGT